MRNKRKTFNQKRSGVDGSLVQNMPYWVRTCGMNLSGSAQGSMIQCCKHDNEPSSFLRVGNS